LRRKWQWRYKTRLKVIADQSMGMVDVKYVGRKNEPLIV
jgi:ribonuclease G